MNTNSLVFEIMRGKWLMNFANVSEYEKLANKYISGEFVGQALDRSAFRAAYDNGNVGGIGMGSTAEAKQIGYLMMTGPMSTYGDMCTYGADDYLYALRRLNNNEKVSAIVLEMDGPGGAVSAINAFKEFKSEKKKPIVVLANDCYSLHYWIACLLGDHVMAKGNISAGFGSVGATCIIIDQREAMAKEGLKVMIVNAPGSDLKNQLMQDYYAGKDEEFKTRLQKELKISRDVFVADVKKAFPEAADERIFNADNFSAEEALQMKMIHSIGSEKKAFELATALGEMEDNS